MTPLARTDRVAFDFGPLEHLGTLLEPRGEFRKTSTGIA
jgi:hypothetical protein